MGKPINKGRQTYEIFTDRTPVMVALREMVNTHIRDYLSKFASDAKNGYFSQLPSQWKLSGWAVVLEPEGFQNSHIHPESFVSGVYYIQIPQSVRENCAGEGNLNFGNLFPDVAEEEKIERHTVKPEEGLLVLFPSYFWHSTIPFSGREDRICISFNVMPV